MSQDTVTINGVELPAENLRAACEAYDRDETPVSQSGDVIVADDGCFDGDVHVYTLDDGRIGVTFYSVNYLLERANDALQPDSGTYLRASDGTYGCEIPITADFEVSQKPDGKHVVYYHADDDVSDLDCVSDGQGYDSAVSVTSLELVEYE